MGRTPAWEAEYVEYVLARQRSFLRTAYAMLGSWPAAEDAAQSTFTALYANWPRIRSINTDAYGRRVLVNTCITAIRKRAREVVTDRVPERESADDLSAVELMDALARLPVRDRAVLALRYLEDLSVRDVAAACDVPEGTVKSQTSRALARLEELLSAPEPSTDHQHQYQRREKEPAMTIDQQLRDRFDRATDRPLPTIDLPAAIEGGRRIRRRRTASYAAGSLAVAAIAAGAVLAPLQWSGSTDRVADGLSTASGPASDDSPFVAGTDIDERLAASVAADVPVLPAPTDVYALDWRRAGNEAGYAAPPAALRLPDDQFGDATAWQLRYDIAPGHTVLITVASEVDGELPGFACDAEGFLSVGPYSAGSRDGPRAPTSTARTTRSPGRSPP